MAAMARNSGGALDSLYEAGIDFVITKGPGIGLLSKSRADRTFGDLDVIVRPEDFLASVQILSGFGFFERLDTRPPRVLFGLHCREAINLRSPNGASLDIHHRIPPWLWSSALTVDVLLRDSVLLDYEGSRFPIASPPHNLLVTALHIVSDQGQPGQTLRSWRDLVLLAQSCDPERTIRSAREAGLCGWLEWIIRSLPEELRPLKLLELLSGDSSPIAHHTRLQMMLSPRATSRRAVEQVLRIPMKKWLYFAVTMAYPCRSYVQVRFPGRRAPYLHWWRQIAMGGERV